MADVELLPLPEWTKRDDLGGLVPSEVRAEMRDYARACVEANLAPLQAENERLQREVEALRAELDNKRADGVHTCGDHCQRDMCVLRRRAERLEEALHKLEEACDDSDGAQYGTLGTSFVRGICKDALLREQEEGREQND